MQFYTTLSSQDFQRLLLLLKSIQKSSFQFYFNQPICLKFLPNFRETGHLPKFRAFAFRSKTYYLCSAEKEVLSYAVKPPFNWCGTWRIALLFFLTHKPILMEITLLLVKIISNLMRTISNLIITTSNLSFRERDTTSFHTKSRKTHR